MGINEINDINQEQLKSIEEDLMIANILAVINNPTIFGELLADEKIKLLDVVKRYAVSRSEQYIKTSRTR